MESILTTKQSEKIIMGTLIIYLSEYSIERQRVFIEQPVIAGGFLENNQGFKDYHLKVKGKIHKSQSSIQVLLDTYIQTTNTFTFSISGVKYKILKLKSYKLNEEIGNHYIECELEFISGSSLEEVVSE